VELVVVGPSPPPELPALTDSLAPELSPQATVTHVRTNGTSERARTRHPLVSFF
jgi:hypothetical protein